MWLRVGLGVIIQAHHQRIHGVGEDISLLGAIRASGVSNSTFEWMHDAALLNPEYFGQNIL